MTTELLTDPGHARGDLRQMESAIRKGWKIPDAIFDRAAIVIGEILAKGNNREKVAAAKVLVAMNEQNNPRQHQGPTINVGVSVDGRIDRERSSLLEIAERIRARRLSSGPDSGTTK